MATTDPRLLIYKQVVLFLNYNKPIKILTHCDFPIGSGLGGSSSLTVALLHAFNELKVIQFQKFGWRKTHISLSD